MPTSPRSRSRWSAHDRYRASHPAGPSWTWCSPRSPAADIARRGHRFFLDPGSGGHGPQHDRPDHGDVVVVGDLGSGERPALVLRRAPGDVDHGRLLCLACTTFMLVLVLVPGVGITANGATRWLGAGPLQIQPSEFAKFALLLFVADLLARRANRIDDWRWTLAPVIAYLAVISALIMMQPNLGTTIIVAAIVLIMLMAAGARLVPLTLTTLVGAAMATSFVALTPFRRTRFLRFLNPMADPLNSGLQNVQSMVAMANGGLVGRGLGRSTVKWGYLPYAWTDFIFAVIGEELGLMGAMFVVLLFLALAILGAWIASRAKDHFSMLVAIGITAWLTVQAIMNIGAVVAIMPITGVPLPFISFGGSALVVNLAAVGMLLNIARHPAEPMPQDGGRSVAPAAHR